MGSLFNLKFGIPRFFYMLFKIPSKKINFLKVGFNLTELHLNQYVLFLKKMHISCFITIIIVIILNDTTRTKTYSKLKNGGVFNQACLYRNNYPTANNKIVYINTRKHTHKPTSLQKKLKIISTKP